MGKTTVVIDEKLLENADRVADVKTKREAIEAGLRELIRRAGREMLRKEPGSFDLDLTFSLAASHRGGTFLKGTGGLDAGYRFGRMETCFKRSKCSSAVTNVRS